MAVAFTGTTNSCSSSPRVSTYFFHLTPKCLRKRSRPLQQGRITRSSAAQCMVSNGRANYSVPSTGDSSGSSIGRKMYKRVGSCLVIPPPKGKKPRAIIKFLGGAFIGAVPEVTYSYLLGLLANEGYLIISVPYNVTFDHSEAAKEVFGGFIPAWMLF